MSVKQDIVTSSIYQGYTQWPTQDFRMGGVEVLEAPMGDGEWVFLPHWGRVWEGLFPLPKKFFVFFAESTIF